MLKTYTFQRLVVLAVLVTGAFFVGRHVERQNWPTPPPERMKELRELWAQGDITWAEYLRLIGVESAEGDITWAEYLRLIGAESAEESGE